MTGSKDARGVDAIIVGAGMAGLVAGIRLAEAGLRVVTVAKGHGCLRLSPATIDILGYAPDRVLSPADALPAFVAEHPDHPYSLLTPGLLAESVTWLKEHVQGYLGDQDANMLLPTAAGVPRPSAVVPETMAGGDVRSMTSVAIAGFAALKDFHPALVADNLMTAAMQAASPAVKARPIMLSPPTEGEADVGTLAFARRFEQPRFRSAVATALRAALRDEQAVGMPAVLGFDQARSVWAELQQAIGRRVFEIPTIPPSVPGMRLARSMQQRLRRAGGRFVPGAEAIGPEVRNGQLVGVRIRAAARQSARTARWVVLATGGLASGGIDVDFRGNVSELVLALPVWGAPPPGAPAFLPGYFDEHPMGAIGLRVDQQLRPVRPDGGEPVYQNVHAAGAVIGGARPWREKSGDGISLSTGYMAAGAILEEAGS